MLPLKLSFVLGIAVFAVTTMHASTVVPPGFKALVERADCVVRADVVRVCSEWRGEGSARRIVTLVTVSVRQRILGDAPATMELEFLGGTVGGQTLLVIDQPQFHEGDSEVLFVEGNGRQLCPLVNMAYGRYPVVKDPLDETRELVVREDGTPLRTAADIARPLHDVAATAQSEAAGGPMSLETFVSEIRKVAASVRRSH